MSLDNTPLPHDPNAQLLNASCMELLLIELVPTAYRMASELAARDESFALTGPSSHAAGAHNSTHKTANNNSTPAAESTPGGRSRSSTSAGGGGGGGGTATAGSMTGATGLGVEGVGGLSTAGALAGLDEEEMRESVFWRLDGLGYRVGLGIVERFSRDKPRFTDTLDVIKFLCKDLWTIVFRKQIDNLKTNHRGIYMLTDNAFKPLSRMSLDKPQLSDGSALSRAQPFLFFPAGLIRGALASMGIDATVSAETSALPAAMFTIRTTGARA